MYQDSTRKQEYIIALTSLLMALVIDLCVFALYGQPVTYLTVILCTMHIFFFSEKGILTIFVLGSMFMFFLYSGELTRFTLCFVPAIVSIIYMRFMFYMNRLFFIIINLFFVCVHVIYMQGWLVREVGLDYYTFLKISVNMILIVFLSLRLPLQSSQGNRCIE